MKQAKEELETLGNGDESLFLCPQKITHCSTVSWKPNNVLAPALPKQNALNFNGNEQLSHENEAHSEIPSLLTFQEKGEEDTVEVTRDNYNEIDTVEDFRSIEPALENSPKILVDDSMEATQTFIEETNDFQNDTVHSLDGTLEIENRRLCLLGMLVEMKEICKSVKVDLLLNLIPDLAPVAVQACNSASSLSRKEAIYCLVYMVKQVGAEEMEKYLEPLTTAKRTLLQIYIDRSSKDDSK